MQSPLIHNQIVCVYILFFFPIFIIQRGWQLMRAGFRMCFHMLYDENWKKNKKKTNKKQNKKTLSDYEYKIILNILPIKLKFDI